MKKMMTYAPIVVAVSLLTTGVALAKVTAAEADKLGKELTCVGAEKAGSKNGVPEYTGKWVGVPPGVNWKLHSGQHPVDIYANEKPVFSISAENVGQYADRLSEGQKAMFAKYGKTYRIPVYPGHRDFRYNDSVCAVVKKNALEAEVTDDGLGVKGTKGGMLFPFPKDGLEVLWNNLLPARAYNDALIRDFANVFSDGTKSWGRAKNMSMDLTNDPALRGKPMEGVMAYSYNGTLLPERDKGGVTVSAEPTNFAKNKRLAWSYDPGTRRVRQVPEYGFDQPMGGTGGKVTIDSDRLFNGSPIRYNWKSLGKREMYIPANAFKVHANTVKYADLLTPNHPNADFLRYELRRVWVLEGTVKEGFRHLFGKRVMFMDEDTGHAVAADLYDARGKLWQHAFYNYYYSFDTQAWHAGTAFFHDLNSGSYMAFSLFQELPLGPVLNKGDMRMEMFTPEAARNAGN